MSKGGEGMKEGWKMVKLKNICDKASSNVAQKDLDNNNGEYPIYGASGFIKKVDFFHYDKPYIGIVKDGSGVGRVNIYPANSSLLGTLQYILPKTGYELGFVYYALQSLNLSKYKVGAAIPHIYFRDYGEKKLSVPPLEEQHRIVDILDATFAKIDALKKNAEENLKNAKALFQQVLAQELKPKEGWRKYILENICTNIVDCPHSTPQKSDEITNYPCIRTSELRNGKIYWDSMQYLDKYEYEKRVVRLIPKAGDIVYGREGTFGDAVLLPEGYNFSLGQRTMLLRPDTTIVCSEFLLITMISPYVYKQAKDKNSGCGVGHVNVKDIKKFTIYLPDDISEQHRIVHTLDTLSEKCRRLEQVAQQTIRECDALKQSILRQAFSGEL